MYSLISTAQANGLNTYDYLVKLFRELPYAEYEGGSGSAAAARVGESEGGTPSLQAAQLISAGFLKSVVRKAYIILQLIESD